MIENKLVAEDPDKPAVIDIQGFSYYPPHKVGESMFFAPNIIRVGRLIARAQTPEELAKATEIYGAVIELEMHALTEGMRV